MKRIPLFKTRRKYIHVGPAPASLRLTVLNKGILFICFSNKLFSLTIIILLSLPACSQQTTQTLTTIADAREHPARFIDNGETGDSVGDILVFDQPLLDKEKKPVGNNSGFCIRTRVAHSFQCQWTLTTDGGSIQVAGREYDKASSDISIVGGTGKYAGIRGEMTSTNNNDGTFTQELRYTIRH